MSFWTRNRRPQPEDYSSDEEYQQALCCYEDAEADALDAAHEQYYEDKYGG